MLWLFLSHHSLYLHLDVLRLLPHGDLGEAGEVDHREAQNVCGVELEADGLGADAFVAPRHSIRLRLDLLPDLVPVCEHLVLGVQELRPLLLVDGAPLRTAVNPVILRQERISIILAKEQSKDVLSN